MAKVFSSNNRFSGRGSLPEPNGSRMWLMFKDFLTSRPGGAFDGQNGNPTGGAWTVVQSAAGTVSSVGDIITSADNANGGMSSNVVWWVMRDPDGVREFLFFRNLTINPADTNGSSYMTVAYSAAEHFSTTEGHNGTVVSAINPPIAPDMIWLNQPDTSVGTALPGLTSDVINIVSTPDATDGPTSVTLVNALKVSWNAHMGLVNAHRLVTDSAHVVSTASASDLSSALALYDDLKTAMNGHFPSSTLHPTGDAINSVTDAPATQGALNTALNSMKTIVNTHYTNGLHGINPNPTLTRIGLVGAATDAQWANVTDFQNWNVHLYVDTDAPHNFYMWVTGQYGTISFFAGDSTTVPSTHEMDTDPTVIWWWPNGCPSANNTSGNVIGFRTWYKKPATFGSRENFQTQLLSNQAHNLSSGVAFLSWGGDRTLVPRGMPSSIYDAKQLPFPVLFFRHNFLNPQFDANMSLPASFKGMSSLTSLMATARDQFDTLNNTGPNSRGLMIIGNDSAACYVIPWSGDLVNIS